MVVHSEDDSWLERLTKQLATMRTAVFQSTLLFLAVSGEYFNQIPNLLVPESFEHFVPKQELFLSSAGVFRPPPDPKGQLWVKQRGETRRRQGLLHELDLARAALEGWGRFTIWGGIEADDRHSTIKQVDIREGSDWHVIESMLSKYASETILNWFPISDFTWAHSYPFDSPSDGWQNGASPMAPPVPSGEPSDLQLEPNFFLPGENDDRDDDIFYDDPPIIPSRILFGTAPIADTTMGYNCDPHSGCRNPCSSLSEDEGGDFYSSDDSIWTDEFVPFLSLPTLFPYHISSGSSFHGRFHSNSTLSSIISESDQMDLEELTNSAWGGTKGF